MHTDKRPEDDDEEAVDKYLNVELITMKWEPMTNDADER
jgi:hypothetical protein